MKFYVSLFRDGMRVRRGGEWEGMGGGDLKVSLENQVWILDLEQTSTHRG